jgi:hypothetical protein
MTQWQKRQKTLKISGGMGQNCKRLGFTVVDKWTADGDRRSAAWCDTSEPKKLKLKLRLRKNTRRRGGEEKVLTGR